MNLKNIVKFAIRLMAMNILALLKAGEWLAEFVRENAKFVTPKICILLVAGILPMLFVGGCGMHRQYNPPRVKATPPPKPPTHGYKTICTGKCEIPFHQAVAKCTALANSATVIQRYTPSGARILDPTRVNIKWDCIAGEGYESVKCVLAEDPDCKP